MLSTVVKKTSTVDYDVSLARHFMQAQISQAKQLMADSQLPGFTAIFMLDSVIAKVS